MRKWIQQCQWAKNMGRVRGVSELTGKLILVSVVGIG